jgi:hypothetical protein
MGGEANMLRTSNVLPKQNPGKPVIWPVLDMLSGSPI